MELVLILVFTCLDIFFFYIFFEIVLIPMFLVIGVWGSRQRKIRAAYLFFLYTLLGSLFMLIGVVYIYRLVGSTNYIVLSFINFSFNDQKWLWLLFFASFAAKVPMLPFHSTQMQWRSTCIQIVRYCSTQHEPPAHCVFSLLFYVY